MRLQRVQLTNLPRELVLLAEPDAMQHGYLSRTPSPFAQRGEKVAAGRMRGVPLAPPRATPHLNPAHKPAVGGTLLSPMLPSPPGRLVARRIRVSPSLHSGLRHAIAETQAADSLPFRRKGSGTPPPISHYLSPIPYSPSPTPPYAIPSNGLLTPSPGRCITCV